MKALRLVLVITFSLMANYGLAHEGHAEQQPLDQAQAITVAAETKLQLIEQGKLAAPWTEIASSTAELVRLEGIQNWVVSYVDVRDNKLLTMIFSNSGTYISMQSSKT